MTPIELAAPTPDSIDVFTWRAYLLGCMFCLSSAAVASASADLSRENGPEVLETMDGRRRVSMSRVMSRSALATCCSWE